MKNNFFNVAVIILSGMVALWGLTVILAFILLSNGQGEFNDKVGQFGDFFGYLNSFISIIGFGGVIYSLHRQHEDSEASDARYRATIEAQKEDAKLVEERHNETLRQQESAKNSAEVNHRESLAKQQTLFERDTTMKLFERRVTLLRILKQYAHNVENSSSFNLTDLQVLTKELEHAHFLFPKNSEAEKFVIEIYQNGARIFKHLSQSPIKRNPANDKAFTDQGKSLAIDIDMANLDTLFEQHLRLAY